MHGRLSTSEAAEESRRDSLATPPPLRYEVSFHLICWPVPALLAGLTSAFGYLGDAGAHKRKPP